MPLKHGRPAARGRSQTGHQISKNDDARRINQSQPKPQVLRRHHVRLVSAHRIRQARLIHAAGPVPLACLLTEIALGGDAEAHIEAFVRAAENVLALAVMPPEGSA
jgi:hypothetical protein